MVQNSENRWKLGDRCWKMLTSVTHENSEKWTLRFSVAMNQDEPSVISPSSLVSSESLCPLKPTPTKTDTDYESSRLSLSCDLLVDYSDEVTSRMNHRNRGSLAEKSVLFRNFRGEEVLPTETVFINLRHRTKKGKLRKGRGERIL